MFRSNVTINYYLLLTNRTYALQSIYFLLKLTTYLTSTLLTYTTRNNITKQNDQNGCMYKYEICMILDRKLELTIEKKSYMITTYQTNNKNKIIYIIL